MIAMSVDKLKIVIELHEGEKSTKKVWRFNVAEHYSKSKLEHEIEGLFPHITNKGLKLNLYHNDELRYKLQCYNYLHSIFLPINFKRTKQKEG